MLRREGSSTPLLRAVAAVIAAVAAGLLLVAPPAHGAAAAGPVAADWGANAAAYRGQSGRFDYVCPAGGTPQSLWGTGVYTDDSSVCTAAAHAGSITTTDGGLVTIEIRPGQTAYGGGDANGITARTYGSYYGSFAIVASTAGGGQAGVRMGGLGWTATVRPYRGADGTRYLTICPAGGTVARVWGSGPYTDDSYVCAAGVHAGVITVAAGGSVVAEIRPSLSSYAGSTRNGVTSASYGAWGGSIVIVGAKPVAAATTTAPATPGTVAGGSTWSADTRAFRSRIGLQVRFTCPAGGRLSVVWGSGTYTDDSSVCSAAVHAGLISLARGGTVVVRITPARTSYAGTARNGVVTRAYGRWPGSFVFVR
jgi:hypothetical protein